MALTEPSDSRTKTKARIAVTASPQHAEYADIRATWIALDELGVDVISTWDHFFPYFGDPDGNHFECMTLLAGMSEVIEHAELGSLVISNTYRNPNLLADMARTIDHISGGRLVLGIGAGWSERDHVEYGYEFGTPISRLRLLQENLPVIKARLGLLKPPPVRPIPLLLGGTGEKVMLKLVAQYADIWHGWGEPEVIRHKGAVLDRWCVEIGRNPAEIERSAPVNSGPWNSVDSDWDEMHDAGVTMLQYRLDPPYDVGPIRELLAWRDRLNA